VEEEFIDQEKEAVECNSHLNKSIMIRRTWLRNAARKRNRGRREGRFIRA